MSYSVASSLEEVHDFFSCLVAEDQFDGLGQAVAGKYELSHSDVVVLVDVGFGKSDLRGGIYYKRERLISETICDVNDSVSKYLIIGAKQENLTAIIRI